ncbi:Serine/threonine protein kinase [Handroanthus impetiginosus]|uniref:Serine/threonine protein kinase n=1 Tax=Handroanthus impetiginosus TaxID=429701 RepID=A0A2G9GKD6_9LAMI|nr:Serine/threonine protein kinase [Handroanthus impetiginosus]
MQNAQNPLFSLFLIALTCSYFINPCYGNAELKALMEMKSSLDPANKYLSSWTPDGDPCSGAFEGVACNEHQKVANISLQGKGLAGKVPPAVAELKCLSGLYLHYNSLSGEIPKEIANLTELTDLYLNVNNLSGSIPFEIGSMASLQVLQLCCNSFTGSIPTEMGLLKKLTVLTLENNRLTGQIPPSLGDLGMLKRLYLSSNQLSGPIPFRLANLPSLEVLDLQNNTLSGVVPPATFPITTCNQTHCSKSSSKLPQIAIVAGVFTLTVALTVVVFVCIVCYRRKKQKVGNKSDTCDDRASSIDQAKDLYRRSPSPLVSLEYSEGWDPTNAAQDCNGLCHEFLHGSKFNLEEVESATQHFSSVNLLGKSKFSAVYKGILKDGSIVAIKSISKTSCKTDEDEFMKGLSLLNSLKHENLVKLKGFCCSKARGECFLIYEFASKGNLSTYFDADEDGSTNILDWPTRFSIIHGIARGIEYLHSNEIIHQNISVEKVALDQQLKPLILDSGLLKLLADDVVYSALKVSAGLGYMAPEYITTGRFTEKSDVYAYGVIILQLLSGQRLLSGSMRMAAECGNWEDFIDSKLEGKFSETEAKRLTKIALDCTNEVPENRPNIASVVQEFDVPRGG